MNDRVGAGGASSELEVATRRYLRHEMIDWFPGERLRRARFAVVGAGAVGNEVIKNLVLLGVGHIDVYDFDTIEVHNLTRSVLFRDRDVGRAKAVVAAERARELDAEVEVEAIVGDVWETLRLSALPGYNAVLSCLDGFEARVRLNALCLLARVDLLNAAIDSRFASVELFPFSITRGGPCYECGLPATAYARMAERYSCGWLRRHAFVEDAIPTTVVTAASAASLMVSWCLHRMTAHAEPRPRRALLDTVSGSSSVSELSRRAECPACADGNREVTLLEASARLGPPVLAGGRELPGDLVVRCSDPIVTSVRCVACDEAPRMVFERADRHDDRLTVCPRCGRRSVDVTIRDQFALEELTGPYAGLALPAKYVHFELGGRRFVVELREG